MTTAAATAPIDFTPAGPFVVTECPEHGLKTVSDRRSFVLYVEVARDCAHGVEVEEDYEHRYYHVVMQHDCWVCCDRMVIDPDDVLS